MLIAEVTHTVVNLDLSYIERKLNRCLKLLDEKPEDALAQLVLAQNTGVRFSLNKSDHPLVEAQSAMRLAQNIAEQERFEAANAIQTLARNQSERFRGLMGKSADEKVADLDEEMREGLWARSKRRELPIKSEASGIA